MAKDIPQNQTAMVNEVTIIPLPPAEAGRSPDGQLRSDRLPPMPAGSVFCMMQVLEKPEPIKKARN